MTRRDLRDPITYTGGIWDQFHQDIRIALAAGQLIDAGVTVTWADHGQSVEIDEDVPVGVVHHAGPYGELGR